MTRCKRCGMRIGRCPTCPVCGRVHPRTDRHKAARRLRMARGAWGNRASLRAGGGWDPQGVEELPDG
jgi:hypothetical protein